MAAKDLGSSEAPPTSAPSISSCDMSAVAFSGFTDPPYRMRNFAANYSPKISVASLRMVA